MKLTDTGLIETKKTKGTRNFICDDGIDGLYQFKLLVYCRYIDVNLQVLLQRTVRIYFNKDLSPELFDAISPLSPFLDGPSRCFNNYYALHKEFPKLVDYINKYANGSNVIVNRANPYMLYNLGFQAYKPDEEQTEQ